MHAASLAKDTYFVAVKLLLRNESKLLITHDIFGAWDIPGGRIRKDQFDVPLEQILNEKIAVELGTEISYELGDLKTTMRVERKESGLNGQMVRIFAVCYEAKYLGGGITLGEHHDKYHWFDMRSDTLLDYAVDGGWMDQLAEYIEESRGS